MSAKDGGRLEELCKHIVKSDSGLTGDQREALRRAVEQERAYEAGQRMAQGIRSDGVSTHTSANNMKAKKTLFRVNHAHTHDPVAEVVVVDIMEALGSIHPAKYGWGALQDQMLSGTNSTIQRYGSYQKKTRSDMYKCK